MSISNLRYYQPEKATDLGTLETDICVLGGTAAGVVAALQAQKMGHRVMVFEASGHLGGLTTGGLSCTDFGRKDVIGGMSHEFYKDCGKHYGVDEEWKFEPKVATKVLIAWVEKAGLEINFHQCIQDVQKDDNRITSIRFESGTTVSAKMFIDCTYEGDLLGRAGVDFTVGREGNTVYNETFNGAQILQHHQFLLPVDPYVIPGDPYSGLLPSVEGATYKWGEGDHRVQAYNFRVILTQDKNNFIPFEKPEGYDAADYELFARYFEAGWEEPFRKFDPIRGNKVDMNNFGGFSTDYIGGNYQYPNATFAKREEIFQNHVRYQKGLMWFRSHDSRVPQAVREQQQTWGLTADEFTDIGGWSPQLYIREARRMQSDAVMTQLHCMNAERIDDPVGMASYTMDSHNCQRLVHQGNVFNEGDVQIPVSPYPVSWRAIRPKKEQCANLLVPLCLSSSHIAYGSIRMEPVFMLLSQSAATAASIAISNNSAVQDIDYGELRGKLLEDGQVLG